MRRVGNATPQSRLVTNHQATRVCIFWVRVLIDQYFSCLAPLFTQDHLEGIPRIREQPPTNKGGRVYRCFGCQWCNVSFLWHREVPSFHSNRDILHQIQNTPATSPRATKQELVRTNRAPSCCKHTPQKNTTPTLLVKVRHPTILP